MDGHVAVTLVVDTSHPISSHLVVFGGGGRASAKRFSRPAEDSVHLRSPYNTTHEVPSSLTYASQITIPRSRCSLGHLAVAR